MTLYVPSTVWNTASSQQTIVMVELDNAPCSGDNDEKSMCTIALQDFPILNSHTGNNFESGLDRQEVWAGHGAFQSKSDKESMKMDKQKSFSRFKSVNTV